jgi:hypothetical protein
VGAAIKAERCVTVLLAALIASGEAQEKPKLAHVEVSPYYVSVEGIWRPDNPTKQNEVIEAVTSISCSKHGGTDLVGTDAWCLEASASAPMGILTVDTFWLKVVEWSSTQIIVIEDSPICVTSQTIFDLRNKTVMSLAVRKPDAKGVSNVCQIVPDRQTYYFQDKADYYLNKALHPKR